MMDDLDIKNLNDDKNNEDTLYFGDEDPNNYESKSKVYKEEDMYENYKPMSNVNSVEYDDGDYASPLYGVDREEDESSKRLIFAYIFGILFIVLVIMIGIIGLSK